MALVKVASVSDLHEGALIEVMIGNEPYAVCNASGELHAMQGVCPHRGGPLGQGALNGNMVTCPWHAWEFDCRTGQNDYDPAVKIAKYDVKISGDDVFLDLP